MRLWKILLLVATLAASPSCRAQQKNSAVPDRLDLRAMENQLDVAPLLRGLDLSTEQIAQFQKFAAPVTDALRQYRAATESNDLRAAFLKVRDAALAGSDDLQTRGLWETHRSELRSFSRTARDVAAKSGEDAFGILTPTQRVRLGIKTLGKKVNTGPALIAEARGFSPADWEKWRDQFSAKVAAEIAGKNFTPDVQAPFLAFCERARNMPADEFAEKAASLSREWRGMLLESLTLHWGKRHEDNARQELGDWFASEGFADTLARLATLMKEAK